jgi:hypothetical protein
MTRRSTIVLAASLATAASASAFADLTYTVEAGVGQSDNITRVDSGEIDETLGLAGLELKWDRKGPRLEAEVDIDADYLHYSDGTYDDEVVGSGNALLNIGIIPDSFFWRIEDNFGQELSDPFAPVTPETREQVNYFTTGPEFMMRLGQAGILRVFGGYSLSEYETSPLDSERVVGGLAVGRRSGEGKELTLNGVHEEVSFDDDINTDFDRDSLFVNYVLDAARTDVNVEAGYTWLEPATGEKSDDPLFNLSITRELTSASTLQLELGTQLTDSSDALRSSADGFPTGGGSQVIATSDSYENKSALLGWNFARHRTALGVSVSWDENRYETQSLLDRTLLIYNLSLSRQSTPTLSLGLTASLMDEEFDNNDLTTDTTQIGATVDWQFARTLGLRLAVERHDRDGSDGSNYTENRAFLSLYLRPARGAAR